MCGDALVKRSSYWSVILISRWKTLGEWEQNRLSLPRETWQTRWHFSPRWLHYQPWTTRMQIRLTSSHSILQNEGEETKVNIEQQIPPTILPSYRKKLEYKFCRTELSTELHRTGITCHMLRACYIHIYWLSFCSYFLPPMLKVQWKVHKFQLLSKTLEFMK